MTKGRIHAEFGPSSKIRLHHSAANAWRRCSHLARRRSRRAARRRVAARRRQRVRAQSTGMKDEIVVRLWDNPQGSIPRPSSASRRRTSLSTSTARSRPTTLSREQSPDLAEKWDSADAKTWTFSLRRGVKWHGGFGEHFGRRPPPFNGSSTRPADRPIEVSSPTSRV